MVQWLRSHMLPNKGPGFRSLGQRTKITHTAFYCSLSKSSTLDQLLKAFPLLCSLPQLSYCGNEADSHWKPGSGLRIFPSDSLWQAHSSGTDHHLDIVNRSTLLLIFALIKNWQVDIMLFLKKRVQH